MKQLIIASLFILLTIGVHAQKYIPVIKPGTAINYTAHLRNFDQNIPILLTIQTLGDPTNIQYHIDGLGTGVFSVSAKAQQSGTKIAIRTPEADDVTKLKDDETFVTVSKSTFNSMLNNIPFNLNGIKFTPVANDTVTYKINNKVTSVLHAITANGKGHLWVLNNPDFPLICGEMMVAKGVDLTLLSITE